VYRNISPEALHVDVVPTHYFFRNPNLLRTRGSDEPLGGSDLNATFPVRPNRGVNRGYTPGTLRPDGSLASYTSACAPTVYRGDRLPAELYGNVFVAEPTGNLVSRIIVSDDGTAFRGRKAYETAEFLVSTDERFRPVNLSSAPDGTLYVVDMYRGIIQHMAYMTEYLRGNIIERQLEAPVHKGRIFRVVHDTTRRGPTPSLATESSAGLADRFAHPNGWWRDTAQRILVERGDRSVVPVLTGLAQSAPIPARLHALWTLDGLDALDASLVLRALEDRSRDLRVSATRLAERWLGQANHAMQAAVITHIDDPNWAVRPQVAASLGALPSGQRETVLASILDRHGHDPLVVDAALTGLRGAEGVVLEKLLALPAQTAARESAIVMVTATLIRARQEASIQSMFRAITDAARPAWQRDALLRGAEVALLGAPAPSAGTAATPGRGTIDPARGVAETSGRGRGAGGRGGTAVAGSAPAFPGTRPSDPNGRPAPTGTLRLQQQPSLVGLAATDPNGFGLRATRVLERVEWPGKPGVVPVAPLTAEESRRFDTGRSVYANACQACHQPDGQGQDKLAPSLVGSALALARADVTARILLNGKEGIFGLMPPVGAALSDDEMAAVLTYIRREWGQAGAPVDATTIKRVRTQAADRQKPWTNFELSALSAAGEGPP
jgi:mono/diheme cytochrome c family protein